MKYEYVENPLSTKIHLDESEKANLRLQIEKDLLLEKLVQLHCGLREDTINVDVLKNGPASLDFLDEPGLSKWNSRIDQVMNYYTSSLNGTHVGDCTAFAAPCGKCEAISKISNLTKIVEGEKLVANMPKEVLFYVDHAFSQKHVKTLEDAQAYVSSLKISYSLQCAINTFLLMHSELLGIKQS